MLDEIIPNIPADPTTAEVREAVEDGISATVDYAELLKELLEYGMSEGFEDKLMDLLVDGVREVNDDCEEDMFGC